MTVSAFFVTRNHAAHLERAIRSVAGIATEVLVVDTGSTDGTVELAKQCGARVEPFVWNDDFAAACNSALTHATGDWILWMNPDEELDETGSAALSNAVNHEETFAFQLRVQQELRPDRRGYGTSDLQTRLFRRDSAIRFRGRLYPGFVTPLQEIAKRRRQIVGVSSAVVHRLAYLSNQSPEKLRWAVRLLEAELNDRPGQLQYLIQYGRHLLWLNEPRGHDVLAEAALQVKLAAELPQAPHSEVGRLLEYLLQVDPQLSKSAITRDEARALAAKWFAGSPPVMWAVASERFAAGDHRFAVDVLNQLLELGTNGMYESGGGFDPEIMGSAARMNLAVCQTHLQNWEGVKAAAGPLLMEPTYRERAFRLYGNAEQHLKN